MTLQATQFAARSPLYRLQAGATLARFGESCIVTDYGQDDESALLSHCALLDLTNQARYGLRGPAAAEYLSALGYRLPQAPNQALSQADGSHVLRLSQTEYLLLGSLHDAGARAQREESQWQASAGQYLLPRQDSHAWLVLSGTCGAEAMAKLCGVDLSASAFAVGQVAQTSAARINVIVANLPLGDAACLHILCDRASVHYLWGALLDAMQEFGGRPVGIDALP
ncbi:sarcosine oxidase [Ectopseudomonas mendocina]|nr:sarcosine oxidase [Pseudomonas mendocina]